MDYFPFNIDFNSIYMLPGIYQPLHSWTTCCLDITTKFWGSVLTDLSTCTLCSKNHRKRRCLSFRDHQDVQCQSVPTGTKNAIRRAYWCTFNPSPPFPCQGSTSSSIPIKAALHVIKGRYTNFTNLNCCLMFSGKTHGFLCTKKQFQLRTLPQPRWVSLARQDRFLSLG